MLTMLLCRYCFIAPLLAFAYPDISLQLTHACFFLLILSTVLIAAAGYIINDYFDVKADRINKPDKLYIDKGVKRRVAIFTHTVFNVIGFGLAVFVAYKAGRLSLSVISFFSITLLWVYSTWLKKKVLLGNLAVSVLSAMVPVQVLLFDLALMEKVFDENLFRFTFLYFSVSAFATFAFLLSMIREIIKDMEDVEGDVLAGRKTIPIAWGIKASKAIVAGLISNTLLLLVFIFYKLAVEHFFPLMGYLLLLVFIPLVFLLWKIYGSQTKAHYHMLSTLTKYIMVLGVCSTLIIYTYVNGFRFTF